MKRKNLLPILAAAVAIAGSVLSVYSKTDTAFVNGFYYDIEGYCTNLPLLSCDNNPFGSICIYNNGRGYTEVYSRQIEQTPTISRCAVVLRHSYNGGKLN